MTKEAAIRVFLVDDHEMVRQGLRIQFAREPDIEVAGEAATAARALERVPVVRPDVAVLDVHLPDGDGVSLCRAIRSAAPRVACLMLTGSEEDQAVVGAIMAGAAGYVRKENFAETLVDAVRTVAAGGSALDEHAARVAMGLLRERMAGPDAQQLLELIGDGLTDRQIAARLSLPEKTVKAEVRAVCGLLGLPAGTASGARRMAAGRGGAMTGRGERRAG
jgi:two-component system, NarL family, response regulator DevR